MLIQTIKLTSPELNVARQKGTSLPFGDRFETTEYHQLCPKTFTNVIPTQEREILVPILAFHRFKHPVMSHYDAAGSLHASSTDLAGRAGSVGDIQNKQAISAGFHQINRYTTRRDNIHRNSSQQQTIAC